MGTILIQCCDVAAKVIKCGCDVDVTNNYDPEIAGTICHAFISVTEIIVVGFLIWKLMEYVANGIAGWRKRVWEVEDIKRKQEADLKKRFMDFLEKNTSKGEYNKEKDKTINTLKEFRSDENQYYIDVMKEMMGDCKNPNCNPKSDEKQKS